MSQIPKIFFQTWKTSEVPDKWKESGPSYIKHHPDHKYILTTDEDNRKFVKEHFPDFLETYDSFDYPIMRADAIRYMWLYVNGGKYFDLDIKLLGNTDHLFLGDLVLVNSSNVEWKLTNSIMASRPGHPIWLEIIQEIKNNPKGPWWAYDKINRVIQTTGPAVLHRVVKRSK